VYMGGKPNSDLLAKAYRAGVDKEKEALSELFQDAGWRSDEFLKDLKDSDNFYLEHVGLVKMKAWSQGRVALVGDAGYCPSVMTGMGTTSAFVGAYILAGEISKHCGLTGTKPILAEDASKNGLAAALKGYEEQFRPFMDQVQKGVSEGGGGMMPTSAFGIKVFNWAVGIISVLRLNVIGEWFLKENIKGWKLPDYPEMVRD
jgi:2-polyprenyl-6-methoxyphenol hydroxylase-like FAD-dependent oxidoreductase